MESYATEYRRLRDDPATPFWVAGLLKTLDEKDPIDALNGIERVLELQAKRVAEVLNQGGHKPGHYHLAQDGHGGREFEGQASECPLCRAVA